ncbi:UxaA family hydrolase, partial [Mycobacterium tuberculosis]|nr:UxaA family hydrolase [Mycobacterium tuberculosis]
GYASDLLVRCGATVMFSEVTEVRDAIHLLTPRAINEEVGKRLLEEMAWQPGVLWFAVTAENGKIIAHSDPQQVGDTLYSPPQ